LGKRQRRLVSEPGVPWPFCSRLGHERDVTWGHELAGLRLPPGGRCLVIDSAAPGDTLRVERNRIRNRGVMSSNSASGSRGPQEKAPASLPCVSSDHRFVLTSPDLEDRVPDSFESVLKRALIPVPTCDGGVFNRAHGRMSREPRSHRTCASRQSLATGLPSIGPERDPAVHPLTLDRSSEALVVEA
jgi:hypothetical protein